MSARKPRSSSCTDDERKVLLHIQYTIVWNTQNLNPVHRDSRHKYCQSWLYVDIDVVYTSQPQRRSIQENEIQEKSNGIREHLTPLAVRTGLALIFGRRSFLYDSGIAAIISTKRGCKLSPYFADALHFTLQKKNATAFSFSQ